jgi:glutathione synthase/RimK-type ligase-like ATP-grasp enzyme
MARAGLQAEPVSWDAGVDWAGFDLVVIRSPWDHYDRRQEFLRWARAVEDLTALANSAVTIARNTDKSYLRDLHRRGVATIDTVWVEPGDTFEQSEAQIRARGWTRCVVKPNISGGSRDVTLAEGPAAAARAAQDLAHRGWVALVQPYLSAVEQFAEISVIVIGGRVTHAVSRVPVLTSGSAGQVHEVIELDDTLADLVREIMTVGAAGEELLYARIDLVPHGEQWLLMEFEATEPCLFLQACPAAADALAWAIRQRLTPGAGESDYRAGSG